MRRIFIDTAHLLAILTSRDNLHDAALTVVADLARDGDSQFVTTHFVIAELLAAVSAGGPHVRRRAADYVDRLASQPDVSMVVVDAALSSRAVQLYRDRPDKSYSLTDCISMIVCRDMAINDVLTADHDFEQEGFNILLGPKT